LEHPCGYQSSLRKEIPLIDPKQVTVIPNKGWLSTINMGLSTEKEFSERQNRYLFPLTLMLFDGKNSGFTLSWIVLGRGNYSTVRD